MAYMDDLARFAAYAYGCRAAEDNLSATKITCMVNRHE